LIGKKNPKCGRTEIKGKKFSDSRKKKSNKGGLQYMKLCSKETRTSKLKEFNLEVED
jgi:hypothetical protein